VKGHLNSIFLLADCFGGRAERLATCERDCGRWGMSSETDTKLCCYSCSSRKRKQIDI